MGNIGHIRSDVVQVLAIDDDPEVLITYQKLFGVDDHQEDFELLDSLLDDDSKGQNDSFELPMQIALDTTMQGEEGAAMAAEKGYAVILLDMRMPGGWDGLRTAKAISETGSTARIVLITAYMDYTLAELRREIGNHFTYLRKPFDRSELLQLTLFLADDWKREQRLMAAEQEAVRANRSKDRFLASMSHELRTPLSTLLGNCELMAESPLTTGQAELLSSMEVSGKTLLYLINDLLDHSKIEAGRFDIDQVEFNPLVLIKEIREIFSSKASERGILFETRLESEFERMLVGDGRRLSQVLINLLGNAIKFTPSGQVTLTMTLDREQDRLRMVVEDTGIGMDQEVLGRLFSPFEQADETVSGRFGGTGLGLHISRTLVELMGGEISVRSELDTGSRFEVSLPLREGKVLDDLERERGRERQPALALKGRVLIAEDTPELQKLERRMVESYGAEVDFADHGEEAVERAVAHRYDLILMDMQMPVMDGVEATRALRSMGIATPIVALTANVMHAQRNAFFEAGCDGFLSKPIDRVELKMVLTRFLPAAPQDSMDENERDNSTQEYADTTASELLDDDLMMLFVEQMTVKRDDLMAAFAEGRWSDISKIAHTIKGSGASFGYPELTRMGKRLQELIGSGEMEAASAQVEQVSKVLLDLSSR